MQHNEKLLELQNKLRRISFPWLQVQYELVSQNYA